LEVAGVFKHRPMLHRKAWSYLNYSCGYMYGAGGRQRPALARLSKSLLYYPWPYHRREVRMPLARLRLFLTTARRLIRGNRDRDARVGGPAVSVPATAAGSVTP